MSNTRAVFLIGVVGGLVGYACGVAFTPTRAVAQQINPADAGPPDPLGDAGAAPTPTGGGTGTTGTVPRPACLQWAVKDADGSGLWPVGGQGILIEEGWEPFAHDPRTGGVMLRRCVK